MICKNCYATFTQPKTIKTTWEEYYGIEEEHTPSKPMTLEVCPYCGSEWIEETE